MSRKSKQLLAAAVILLIAALGLSAVLPDYILHLVTHPDSSYLSKLLAKDQLKNPELHTPQYYAEYIPAVFRRLLLTCFAFAALIFYLITRRQKDLVKLWNHESTAFNLGVLRIAVLLDILNYDFSQMYSLPMLTADGLNYP